MSKKKAVKYDLSYTHYKSNQNYINVDFVDKKGRTMMSSVSLLLNMEYFNEEELDGFVRAR
jgi:hypothetical protein